MAEITIKNGETEISINEKEISISAKNVILECDPNLESDTSNY